MKYNTISSSSLSSDGKRSTLTIYTDPDFVKEKVATSETVIASIRSELEIVQRALKLQTRRCRQLVAEYTRRLQEKEQKYQSERMLRDDQLAKVLRALLIFEARLRQEQKYISHQLSEKDYIIKKQRNDINKLIISNQYCKHCNQYYSSASNVESLDSSSEYVVTTDCHDYQSSNFESLDSSSETYASVSEKAYDAKKTATISAVSSYSGEETGNSEREVGKSVFQKNKFNKDSMGRRARKFAHRKSVGTYFEVLKLRTDSPTSNEDNTSNDYANLDSLPPESVADEISAVSVRIENTFANSSASREAVDNSMRSNTSSTDSDCNGTVIQNCKTDASVDDKLNTPQRAVVAPVELKNNSNHKTDETKVEAVATNIAKINESITVFDGDSESNDTWYASGSEQEDEEQRDIYRNNPVLECMNQILLHNISDSINSPPKTPNPDRKFIKNSKRVKFSDEEENVNKENSESSTPSVSNYYETPIQKMPNFYETPQSIYSNDYEQILSKCSESTSPTKIANLQEKEVNMLATKRLSVAKNIDFESRNGHYYDMDTKCDKDEENKVVRKSKILRTPPALPPKPTNLVSKYKMQNLQNKLNLPSEPAIESEPDYCSISELNLPTKSSNVQKINVVVEINAPNLESNTKDEKQVILHKSKQNEIDVHYDPVIVNNDIANLVNKNIEKFTVQLAKQAPIKTENVNVPPPKIKPKPEPEIPKLPQVSEIIIPDENESQKEEECISQDNYVKNNSQIFKSKSNRPETLRHPIVIGSSVSSLITGFNNQQLLFEIQQKPERHKPNKAVFTSFEPKQNSEKHSCPKNQETTSKTLSFEFDLSQNFEEFKLEDCEIGEEFSTDDGSLVGQKSPDAAELEEEEHKMPDVVKPPVKLKENTTRVELVRATNSLTIPPLNVNSLQQLRKKLELQRATENSDHVYKNNAQAKNQNEPTYEHFLECTGLSSKSILTPSRLLSNHKSMLKPKDVKLRSKVKSNSVFERHGNTIKYWSEPYI